MIFNFKDIGVGESEIKDSINLLKYVNYISKRFTLINLVSSNINKESHLYHNNYLDYLEKCYKNHYGIIISPDIIWYTILSEFSLIVKKNVETYRSLFSESKEKKDIVIISHSLTEIPIEELTQRLRELVPMESDLFFPKFNYIKDSDFAFLASFCDICSPYYNYCICCCGFPSINILGTIEDYKQIKENFEQLINKTPINITNSKWVNKVSTILNEILDNFNNKNWWNNIYSNNRCGSGSDVIVSGWWEKLYFEEPKLKLSSNYSSHISNIKYKQLETNQDYEMYVGLFNSRRENEFMVPEFSKIIFNTTEYNKELK